MLYNYLKIALRNLYRHRVFSVINILGLALGLTCSLFIWLWVADEMKVDAFHKNNSQLYQVMVRQFYDDGKVIAEGSTQALLSQELKKKFPEIVSASGFTNSSDKITFTVGDKFSKEVGSFAGPDWFKMFSFKLLQGTPAAALGAPNSLAISESLAKKYFGSAAAAMGKTVGLDNRAEFQVTGVFADVSQHSSISFDFLLSWDLYMMLNPWMKDFGNTSPATYVQVRPDTDVPKLNAKIQNFLDTYQSKHKIDLFLQPYGETYLYSNYTDGYLDGGRIEYVRIFSVVAVVILLIACINFMNLSTARSVKRAKEVGVRKVIGAVRSLLVGQFLGEALLLTFLAVGSALLLVSWLLPGFNLLTGKQIVLQYTDAGFYLPLLGLTLITGIIAGSYPALFLSSLNPVAVLKGTLKFKPNAVFLRQGLVVVQFVLSILLLVGTIVVYQQLQYIQTKNVGYNRDNLIQIPIEGELGKKYAVLKDELLKDPNINLVTQMGYSPHSIGSNTTSVSWTGKTPKSEISFYHTSVGYNLVETLKLELKAGRDFSRNFASDSVGYLINDEAAKVMGYKNPVGQPLSFWGKPGKIIGVLKNFHFASLHDPIEPVILRLNEKQDWGYILVRAEPSKTKEALAALETVVTKLNPKMPFTYSFLDEEYSRLYKSEQVVGTLAKYFAFLGIFISCLGLLGLVIFTAEQRTREIGIRKVLGAGVNNILLLLSKDFVKLVLLANLIAWPIAWWAASSWLQGFAYRVPLNAWVLLGAGVTTLIIALFTISFQAIRVAVANPVNALRSE